MTLRLFVAVATCLAIGAAPVVSLGEESWSEATEVRLSVNGELDRDAAEYRFELFPQDDARITMVERTGESEEWPVVMLVSGRLHSVLHGVAGGRLSFLQPSWRCAMQARTSIAPLLLLATLADPLALAGQTGDDPAPTGSELTQISKSLQQIADLLRLQVENQRAELAVQRLDIARRELVARERELHDAESQRDNYVQSQASMETYLDEIERNRDSSGMSEEDLRQMIEQAAVQIEANKQKLWRIDQRILDIRSEIGRSREDLETWEELVAESFREP